MVHQYTIAKHDRHHLPVQPHHHTTSNSWCMQLRTIANNRIPSYRTITPSYHTMLHHMQYHFIHHISSISYMTYCKIQSTYYPICVTYLIIQYVISYKLCIYIYIRCINIYYVLCIMYACAYIII